MKKLFEEKKLYAAIIVCLFIISFFVTFSAIHSRYQLAIKDVINENRSHANLFSSLIYEHENAAISVLESYAQHSAFIDAVKAKDFSKAVIHLQTLQTSYTEMDALFVTDRSGTLWANYPEDRSGFGRNLAYRDWYKGLSRNWKPYVSSVYKLIVLEKGLAVALSVPVFDRGGSVIGTLSAAQRTPFLAAFVNANSIDPDKSVTVLDQEGNIVFSNAIPYEEKITKYPDDRVLEKALTGVGGDLKIAHAGEGGDISYVSVAPVRGLRWSVIIGQRRASILKPLYGYFFFCIATGVGILLLMTGGLLFFRREYVYRKTKELLKAEEKFVKTFRSNPAGVGLSRLSDGLVVEANETMLKLLGYERDEFIGHSVVALCVWNDRADRERLLQVLMTEGRSINQEYWLRTRTGELLLCNHSAELIEIGGEPHIIFTFFDITERKKAERELEKLASVVRHSSEFVNLATLDGKMIFLNEAGAKMVGIEPEQVEQVNIMQVIPDHLRMRVQEEILPELRNGGAWEGELQYLNLKTGKLVDVHAVTFTIKDSKTGEPQFLANVSRDITEAKKAEAALRDSEQRLALAASGANVGIFDWNMLTGEVLWTPEHEAIFGYAPTTTTTTTTTAHPYRDWADRVHTDDLTRVEKEAQRCLAEKSPFAVQYRIVWPDGGVRWVEARGMPLSGDEGRVTRMMGTLIDVTERKQAEEAVRAAERDKALILESANEIIAYHDLDQNLIWANKAYLDALGAPLSDLKGKKCYLCWGLDRLCLNCPVTAAIQTGRPQDAELTPENQPHWPATQGSWSVRAAPVRDGAGNIIGAIEIAHDITARKQAEEEISKRTAQLEAAYKEAESFSYSISHDLRAPLRAIDGFSMMLLKKHGDQFDEESRRKFDVIRSNAQMMGKLIDDILSLSRLGRKQMSIELLNMDAIVSEVWQELQMETANRNINLTTNGMPPGYGDRTLIKQVYANLLGNAVKFSKFRNPAVVEVGGHVHEDENVYYVKDNGAGFDMEYYDKLFGIFQRLHKPEEFEGTGVGLATIQRVINRHGGKVWAEGKVDEGATFYFSLPSSHTQ